MSRRPASPFMALLTLNLKSLFAIHLPEKKALASPKVLLKTFGWIVLAVFLVADFGFMFAMMDIGMYNALAPLGMQSFMLLYATVMSSVIVFLFAFITSLSFFSSAQYEALFLTMPLNPSSLLTARMATVYAIEAPIAFLVMGIAAGVYGIKSHPGFDFYLYMLFNALAMPLVPLAVSYAVLVPVMSVSRWLRRKNTILYVGGFIGLALALGFNFYLQRMMARIENPVLLQNMLTQNQLNFADIADWWPPAWLTMQAIAQGRTALGSIAATLANLALGVALTAAVAFLFGKSYVKILVNFGETSAVKGTLNQTQAGSIFRARPVFLSLVQRELRLMNREPMYLLNGPFVILLLPVIFAITFIAQGDEMRGAVDQIRPYLTGQAEYLIPAGLGIFLATATSIACTAFSRDAKSLHFLKSLPLRPRDIIAAKLVHALIFAALGIVLGTVGGAIMLGVSTLDAIVALLLAIFGSVALNMGGLAIDTFWPRLSWENPMSALKRNPNAVIMILGSMGLIAGFGVLAATLPLAKYTFALLYGTIFVAACFALGFVLFRAGEKRVRQMEP
jgi:ABC-2 type transport system permease protein